MDPAVRSLKANAPELTKLAPPALPTSARSFRLLAPAACVAAVAATMSKAVHAQAKAVNITRIADVHPDFVLRVHLQALFRRVLLRVRRRPGLWVLAASPAHGRALRVSQRSLVISAEVNGGRAPRVLLLSVWRQRRRAAWAVVASMLLPSSVLLKVVRSMLEGLVVQEYAVLR